VSTTITSSVSKDSDDEDFSEEEDFSEDEDFSENEDFLDDEETESSSSNFETESFESESPDFVGTNADSEPQAARSAVTARDKADFFKVILHLFENFS
jgi:hypothetical protein